ncbi:g7664 [Coccomyxa elongata]
MNRNHLIYRSDIGQIKKCTFSSPAKDRVFGLCRPRDPEDAWNVTQKWAEAQSTSAQENGPDYRSMNKQAAICGLTRADQQMSFRFAHPQTLARGIATHKPPPPLPSDKDASHTYGCHSSHRSQEQIRIAGKEDPKMQQLVQGAFQWDWVHAHSVRTHGGTCAAMTTNRLAARTTKAAAGHRAAAAKFLAGHNGDSNCSLDSFKLSRFKRVAPRTNTYRRVPAAVPAAS